MEKRSFIQRLLISLGRIGLFRGLLSWYISKRHLNEDIVFRQIECCNVSLLREYIKYHKLSLRQITMILQEWSEIADEKLQRFIDDMLRQNKLTTEQQALLISINDVRYFESYLLPRGIFDPYRRFDYRNESVYIMTMVQNVNEGKMACTEVLKTYVDNNARELMNDDLLPELIKYPGNYAAQYVLQKARFTREQEEFFIGNAPEALIEYFINERELNSDKAQLLLVEKHYGLAKTYFEKYGLRSQAQQTYHEIRKQALEKAPEEESR